MYTDKLFTRWIEPVEIGQRNIAGLGIYHYQSRFYSPKLGRFLSADSLVPNPFNPQDYNRFAYVRNNPVRYTDPSGHRACITQEECADMGITPNGGNRPKPRPQVCTRNCVGPAKPPVKPQGGGGGGPLSGISGGSGGGGLPIITSTPTPPIQPQVIPTPDVPVPFSSQTIVETSTTIKVETAEVGDMPIGGGYTVRPQIPTSDIPYIEWFQIVADILGLKKAGSDVRLPDIPLGPEKLRVTEITTVTKITVMTFDQDGRLY